jgi:hypothetical protein
MAGAYDDSPFIKKRRANHLVSLLGTIAIKRGCDIDRNPLLLLVGTIGFEPTTSTVSDCLKSL